VRGDQGVIARPRCGLGGRERLRPIEQLVERWMHALEIVGMQPMSSP